jgi:hypothetical protein
MFKRKSHIFIFFLEINLDGFLVGVLLGIIAVAWPVDVLQGKHKLGLCSLDSVHISLGLCNTSFLKAGK